MDEKKQRLLVVDDSRVIRVTARKILKDHFETIEAADGNEAWDILSGEEPVSLVVSDLTMPNLDGYGLLEKIRGSHLPHVRDLPVIIITGADDTETTMQKARSAGATDFIGKPFDSVHLLARTQAHASSHTATNTLRQENAVLKDNAPVDELTGLVNESAFMERAYQQLSYAIRHDTKLSICRIEIDDFGDHYRQHGQDFAASITQSIGEILTAAIRVEDTAARIGAARFALLLPGMGISSIRSLSERIHSELGRRTFRAGTERQAVTVSIGVASPEIRRDMRLDELLVIADQRLGHATALGGGQSVFEDRDDIPVREPVEVEIESVVPVMEMAAEAEPAPQEELTASPPYNPFQDDNLEIEEIELSSPDSGNTPTGLFGNELDLDGTGELTLEPLESEPGSSDETAPEAGHMGLSAVSESQANSHDGPFNACPTAPANDASEHDGPEVAPASPAGSPVSALPFDVRQAGNAANEAPKPSVVTRPRSRRRPGILRRILGALFGRPAGRG